MPIFRIEIQRTQEFVDFVRAKVEADSKELAEKGALEMADKIHYKHWIGHHTAVKSECKISHCVEVKK